jgi:uncharacterized protein (UPF0303 family)
MDAAQDVTIITEQEHLLRFTTFHADTAWALGSLLRTRALATNIGCTIEIEIAGHLLFACTTPGATPSQADWIRRKRNTVRRFGCSSYLINRKLERDGEDFEKRNALSLTDYAAHGGGFPIVINGSGPVGSVIFSGLPQRQDHAIVVAALSELLGIAVPGLD